MGRSTPSGRSWKETLSMLVSLVCLTLGAGYFIVLLLLAHFAPATGAQYWRFVFSGWIPVVLLLVLPAGMITFSAYLWKRR